MRKKLLLPIFSCLAAACGRPPEEVDIIVSAVENAPIPEPMPPVPPPPGEVGLVLVGDIGQSLRLILQDTEIQLTSYEGSTTLPRINFAERDTVCNPPPGAVTACTIMCRDTTVGQQAYQDCVEDCYRIGCTDNVCMARTTPSFVRFTEFLKELTEPGPDQPANCTINTCPACNPAQRVPALRDTHIPVPAKRVYLGYTTTVCRLNWLRFTVPRDVDPSMVLTSDTTGIKVDLTGQSSSPSVHCSSAPNLQLGPRMRITLQPAVSGGRIVVAPTVNFTGSITASQPVYEVLVAAVSSLIRDAIDNKVDDVLDGRVAEELGRRLDRTVRTRLGLSENAWFTSAWTTTDGVKVRFLRNP